MQNLLKISEAASLALHTMSYLAAQPERRVSTHEIAVRLKVSEAHLAKVLQRLGRAGLATSQRGPKGGFTLAKPPQEITLLEVYQAIEGPMTGSVCLLGHPVCGGKCILGSLIGDLDRQVREYFGNTRLSEITLDALWEDTNARTA